MLALTFFFVVDCRKRNNLRRCITGYIMFIIYLGYFIALQTYTNETKKETIFIFFKSCFLFLKNKGCWEPWFC